MSDRRPKDRKADKGDGGGGSGRRQRRDGGGGGGGSEGKRRDGAEVGGDRDRRRNRNRRQQGQQQEPEIRPVILAKHDRNVEFPTLQQAAASVKKPVAAEDAASLAATPGDGGGETITKGAARIPPRVADENKER